MLFDRRDALKALGLAPLALAAGRTFAAPDKTAADAEAERVKVITLVQPAVAAVCFYGGQVCGSGVVISDDGYCLTNFHVVQPTGSVMQCGLADGKLYDSVLVGQDRVGDVALVKLLPKKDGDKFPFVKLGDSDTVEVGDWSLAMGNPFGLALDFTPTVTYGLISGVKRYQPPEGKGTLEYTDCIQFDTSINPGNSGGPLFNMKGELIGINGRGSFEKRGRVNSGVGYAISINQIKNFLAHMKAGIDTDHATLGARVSTAGEEAGTLDNLVFSQIQDDSDAARRGLKPQDQLVAFAGRRMDSTNQFKNVLGIYPMGWRLPLRYKAAGQGATKETLVRLLGNMDKEVEREDQPNDKPPPGPRPNQPPPNPAAAKSAKSPAAKMVEAKKGYANFYFNRQETKRLLAAFKKAHGEATAFTGNWKAEGDMKLADGRAGELKLEWIDDKEGFTEVKLARGNIAPDALKPLAPDIPPADRFLPQGSGGLLSALFQFKLFFSKLDAAGGFKSNDSINPGFTHGGMEPVYPIDADMKVKVGEELTKSRIDCEVIRTAVDNYVTKWYFHPKDATLVGWETTFVKEEDPCEVYACDHKDVNGVKLPHCLIVRWGDKVYATLTIKSYTLGKK
ncbi:MAG: trypsin-like peptidase domain-containing protein [Fimbriiglobus sp.]|jgi:S1-C subfamily serine protease|nr:trypsin-like peptidase domain-containing protein [Fimbriiglobus sp.]